MEERIMTTFRGKVSRGSVRIPKQIKEEESLEDGTIVNINIEKAEE